MSNNNILALIISLAIAIVLVFLMIRKNQKDKKELNPDSENAVELRRTDEERGREKI